MKTTIMRMGICLAFGFALLPFAFGQAQKPKAADKSRTFKGIVMPLDKLLAKQDIKVDPDAAGIMVLQSDDGKVYPLVKDAGSRMFYKDSRLLNRPMRLTARPVANGALLQVINVHSTSKANSVRCTTGATSAPSARSRKASVTAAAVRRSCARCRSRNDADMWRNR